MVTKTEEEKDLRRIVVRDEGLVMTKQLDFIREKIFEKINVSMNDTDLIKMIVTNAYNKHKSGELESI